MSVYELAHKLRCEAREVLHRVAYAVPARKKAFDDLEFAAAALDRLAEAELGRFNSRLPQLMAERDRLAAQERLIAAKIDELEGRLRAWIDSLPKTEQDKGVGDPRNGKARRAQAEDDFAELKKWYESRKRNEALIRDFNSRLSLLERDRLAALQRMARAQREHQQRFRKELKFLGNTFAYGMRFEIEETNDARINTADFTRPLTLGTFSIGLAAGDKKQRKGRREVRVAATFRELLGLEKECAEGKHFMDGDAVHVLRYPIRGRIGLDEVITQYLEIVDGKFALADTASSGKTYISIVTFTTTIDGSIKPSATITRSSGGKDSGNATLSSSRQDLHEATIVIVPPASRSSGADEAEKTINVRILPSDSLLQD